MRPIVVVYLSPAIKLSLQFVKRGKPAIAEELCLQGAMKTLVLSVGLRMKRP
jgi:hypothetical protein